MKSGNQPNGIIFFRNFLYFQFKHANTFKNLNNLKRMKTPFLTYFYKITMEDT